MGNYQAIGHHHQRVPMHDALKSEQSPLYSFGILLEQYHPGVVTTELELCSRQPLMPYHPEYSNHVVLIKMLWALMRRNSIPPCKELVLQGLDLMNAPLMPSLMPAKKWSNACLHPLIAGHEEGAFGKDEANASPIGTGDILLHLSRAMEHLA